MRIRTLILEQLYFGLDTSVFHRGAQRVLARIAGAPPDHARVKAQNVREDFQLDAAAGEALLRALVSNKLLQPDPGPLGGYRVTQRFREFALARVVPPLTRARARFLLARACHLAAQINDDWTSNPLAIDMIAVSGGFMSRSDKLAELTLGVLVHHRAQVRVRRFGRPLTRDEGTSEIAAEFRALSSFVVVHMVSDAASLQRPFCVPFRARDDASTTVSPPRFRGWASSIRLPRLIRST